MKSRLHKEILHTFNNKQLHIDPQFKKQLKKELFKEKTMATNKNTLHVLKQHKMLPLGVVVAALVLVGGASALVVNTNNNNQTKKALELPQDLSDVIAINEIRTRATEGIAAGIDVTGIELEDEDEGLLYKVRYSDGTVRYYNAKTGELVVRSSDDTEIDEKVPADFVAGITLQQAREIAQKERPDKAITKIELEVEEGVVVYSVRFSDDGRVDVSAVDGSVVRVRNGEEATKSDDSSDDSDSSSNDSSDDDGDDSVEDSNDSSDDSDDDNDSNDSDEKENEQETEDDNSGSGSN